MKENILEITIQIFIAIKYDTFLLKLKTNCFAAEATVPERRIQGQRDPRLCRRRHQVYCTVMNGELCASEKFHRHSFMI